MKLDNVKQIKYIWVNGMTPPPSWIVEKPKKLIADQTDSGCHNVTEQDGTQIILRGWQVMELKYENETDKEKLIISH